MSEANENPIPQTTLSKLLPWIVLLLSALGLFYFVEKGCGVPPKTDDARTETAVDSVIPNDIKTDTLQRDSID